MDNNNRRTLSPESEGSGPSFLIPSISFLPKFFVQVSEKIRSSLESWQRKEHRIAPAKPLLLGEGIQPTVSDVSLSKQLQAWRNNPTWTDHPPDVKVSAPAGTLCDLRLTFKAGLPPDAIFNIITDPENKRVFKNIKEVISRKVLIDEGDRQVVEVEQSAIWRFLWWSGTLSVHVFVDQNRRNHTISFKQGRSGFMKKFDGCWKIKPLFVDEQLCHPNKPTTTAEYDALTEGRGRVGSIVTLDQLVQPSFLPPPPISWYLRGITAKTTETLVSDLIAETSRLRGDLRDADSGHDIEERSSAMQLRSSSKPAKPYS